MAQGVEALRRRYFAGQEHPYRRLERTVEGRLAALPPQSAATVLEIGCGRTVPILRRYAGDGRRLIGVDLVEFPEPPPGIELYRTDAARLDMLADGSVDLAYSRSVMEHLEHPLLVYREVCRTLRPGGRLVFLTPNLWDYVSLISAAVPNRFHPRIVRWVQGRAMDDTFPAFYRSNTAAAVRSLALRSGFELESIHYLGQYPSYFEFSATLFRLAAWFELLLQRHESLGFLRGWILCELVKPAGSAATGTAVSGHAGQVAAAGHG